METVSSDEKVDVERAMMQFGGSFVKALGNALIHADPINTQKIKDAFPEYWKEYLEIWKQHLEREKGVIK